MAAASRASPACAFFAASISRLVTPLIAETTATQPFSFAALAIICAALAMQAASPTDVPPNFITCKRAFIPSQLHRGFDSPVRYKPHHSDHNVEDERDPWARVRQQNRQCVDQIGRASCREREKI